MRWRDQFSPVPNASNFHEEVRETFRTSSFFSKLHCYQEVPVVDLVPGYTNSLHRFDWYVEELELIIELHGKQHYKATTYGVLSNEQAQRVLFRSRISDSGKRFAAEEAGYRYVEIAYTHRNKLSDAQLRTLLL